MHTGRCPPVGCGFIQDAPRPVPDAVRVVQGVPTRIVPPGTVGSTFWQDRSGNRFSGAPDFGQKRETPFKAEPILWGEGERMCIYAARSCGQMVNSIQLRHRPGASRDRSTRSVDVNTCYVTCFGFHGEMVLSRDACCCFYFDP